MSDGEISKTGVPLRVLHIVESLDTGAVENWLVRMLTTMSDHAIAYDWTFFCALGRPGRLDDKVKQLGAKVIHSPHPLHNKFSFASHLRKTIQAGNYDILHAHHDFVSAVYLLASLGTKVQKKIVHVHNTDEGILTNSRTKQLLFKEPMRLICMRLADNIVGISNQTLHQFIRSDHPNPARHRVVYYGIDTENLHRPDANRAQLLERLQLPRDAKVLLFAGRMVPLKNPCFVIEVLAEIAKSDANVVAVFAGAGELEATVQAMAQERNLEHRVRVIGWQDDLVTLMQHCDALIFPRQENPIEGLGVVLLEAQAAGLPILASPSITPDVQVVPELFKFLPLAAGAEAWAAAALELLQAENPSRQRALERIENSAFSMQAARENLLSLYADLN